MRTLSDTDILISPGDRPGARSRVQTNVRAKPKAQAQPRKLRRRPPPSLRRTIALVAVPLLLVLVGLTVLWRSGMPQQAVRAGLDSVVQATGQAGFRLTDISVTGRERTNTDDILWALGAKSDSPILAVDLREAKARLESLPSVNQALVERRLPGRLHIVLVERIPFAVWQHDGAFHLVDDKGHVIPGSIEGYQTLPLVVGDGAPAAAPELFAALTHEPLIAPRVKAAIRVGDRRWNLRLDDPVKGLEARLPETEMASALHQLTDLEGKRGLTERHITMVDLRQADRMVVRTGTEQATQPAISPLHDGGG